MRLRIRTVAVCLPAALAIGACSSTVGPVANLSPAVLAGRYALMQPTAGLVADTLAVHGNHTVTRYRYIQNSLDSGTTRWEDSGTYTISGSTVVFTFSYPGGYSLGLPPVYLTATAVGTFGSVARLYVEDDHRQTVYARTR